MWGRVAVWWDSVELWLTQLVFPVQVALVLAVLLPLCFLAAYAIDRGVDRVSDRWGRRRARR